MGGLLPFYVKPLTAEGNSAIQAVNAADIYNEGSISVLPPRVGKLVTVDAEGSTRRERLGLTPFLQGRVHLLEHVGV